MKIKNLITEIELNEVLDTMDKVYLLEKLVNFTYISPGIYFKRKENTDEVEIWYRNVDENGTTEHGKTDWDEPQQVINEYLTTKELRKIK